MGGQPNNMPSHTVTALKRWSLQEKQMPAVSRIKAVHIYDFDNTLFLSPLPNTKLWHSHTVGFLQQEDALLPHGGWWHNKNILEATGQGIDKEEPRAWEGWWNEEIVKLVELSIRQDDAMTVVLTGRGENNFADTIKRMVAAKKLDFDMICLKPSVGPHGQRFESTQLYKQALLRDIVHTYKEIDELKIYEDRPRHVDAFRKFIEAFKKELRNHPSGMSRRDLSGEVIQVYETAGALNPLQETQEVQRMLNSHNLQHRPPRFLIKRTVFYLGYLLSQSDADNLLTLLDIPSNEHDTKFFGNNIMIIPRPSTASVLEKVGGMGAKQIWRVTSFGSFNNVVFAARVQPIQSSDTYFTENPFPMVVLAIRKGGKPVDSTKITHWTPVPSDKQFVFETTVGEKVQLRIEKENDAQSDYDSLFPPLGNTTPYQKPTNNNKQRNFPQVDHDNDRQGGRDNGHHNGEPRRVSDRYRGSAHPHRGNRGGRDRADRDRDRNIDRSRSPRIPNRNRSRDRGDTGHRNGPQPNSRRAERRRERDNNGRDHGGGPGNDRRDRGGGGEGGRNRAQRNAYRSLDDVAADSGGGGGGPPRNERERYVSNGGHNVQPSYEDLMPHAGPEGYGAGFLPLGAAPSQGGQQGRNGAGAGASGGLGGLYDGMEDLHY